MIPMLSRVNKLTGWNRQTSFRLALQGSCGTEIRWSDPTAEHYLHLHAGRLVHVVTTENEQGLESQPSTMRTIKIKCAGYVYPDDPSPA